MSNLVKAIEQKRFKQAELLLKLGANVNQQEKRSGTTPLLAICFLKDENLSCRIAKYLLTRGADVCLQDRHGRNPLMQACKLGKEKLVQVFTESHECDFSAVDSKGNTALMYSIDAGNSRITKFLTEAMNAYDVRVADKPNKKGETPLIRAAKFHRNECINILLSDGKASPCARDYNLKLNAREWGLHFNPRNEDETSNEIERKCMDGGRNTETRYFNGKQNYHDYHERSRMKSSIINNSQGFTNTASVFRHSVNFEEKSRCQEVFHRTTKSASLVKGEHSHDNLVTYNLKLRKSKTFTDKWPLPTKGTVSAVNYPLNPNRKSTQNGLALSKEPHFCDKRHIASKIQQERESSMVNDLLLPSAPAPDHEKKSIKQSTDIDGGEKVAFSPQSQLPKLFTLMIQQKSHSFRSSAKPRILEKPSTNRHPSTKAAESAKRANSRRGSLTAMTRQYMAHKRWSMAMMALDTMGKFPSLYSRSDFKTLDPQNLEAMLDQRSLTMRRRSSIHSNPNGLAGKSSRKQAKSKAIAPNLVELDPVLSHSLPEQSTWSRVKSARSRSSLLPRHNSESSIQSDLLVSKFTEALSKIPVLEETEEVVASDC